MEVDNSAIITAEAGLEWKEKKWQALFERAQRKKGVTENVDSCTHKERITTSDQERVETMVTAQSPRADTKVPDANTGEPIVDLSQLPPDAGN